MPTWYNLSRLYPSERQGWKANDRSSSLLSSDLPFLTEPDMTSAKMTRIARERDEEREREREKRGNIEMFIPFVWPRERNL